MTETVRPRLAKLLIEAMAKHLPPSASRLRLLDVNGAAGAILTELRPDLELVSVGGDAATWTSDTVPAESFDAIAAFGYVLNPDFLNAAMQALRPGGRLVIVNSRGEVSPVLGETLENAGYVRILVETAVECPLPTGVLMRGEKAHTTSHTLERIQQVADLDENALDLESYKGRFVHLLITQTPNKPAWKLDAGEQVEWQAAAVEGENEPMLLAFSSLPKAVAFMQPAVLDGRVKDVNKVGKFSKATAQGWALPVLLNPDLTILNDRPLRLVPVDATTAEAPDE
ncbi:MAG: hypothetical protein SF029_18195 [bacterium]|nr:hypothetical protein [bacterium]